MGIYVKVNVFNFTSVILAALELFCFSERIKFVLTLSYRQDGLFDPLRTFLCYSKAGQESDLIETYYRYFESIT